MNEAKSVYIAWQEPDSREWLVIGELKENPDGYTFIYTRGALASDKFIPFSGMDDLNKIYISRDLFPVFKNRLLSTKRPEYPNFIKWLGLNPCDADPIEVLGRSGALRGTDQLQMFKRIEVNDKGKFEHVFFAHGLSHLSKSAFERTLKLSSGDKLLFCLDCQNSYDTDAVIIRADAPPEIVGFCPRYLSKEIKNIILCESSSINVAVESISTEAPMNYKLMCRIKGSVSAKTAESLNNREEFLPIGV
jgi:hypothetical protein